VDISYTDSELASVISKIPHLNNTARDNNSNSLYDSMDDDYGNQYELQVDNQKEQAQLPISCDISYTDSELESVRTDRLPRPKVAAASHQQQHLYRDVPILSVRSTGESSPPAHTGSSHACE
jgi:hypothetical protein